MSKKKFYAVKKGRKIGIFESWEECKQQTNKFPGAIYQGFSTKKEAEKWWLLDINKEKTADISINNDNNKKNLSLAIAYVDGSYDNKTNTFSYGAIIFYNNEDYKFSQRFKDLPQSTINNVAGEIEGAKKALKFCVEKKIQQLDLYYDLEGIEKWCTGEWKTNNEFTKKYKYYYDQVKNQINVKFIKVKAHSGDQYNDVADYLAKNATFKYYESKPFEKGVYLEITEIPRIFDEIGKKEYRTFSYECIKKTEYYQEWKIIANGKETKLVFHIKSSGKKTIAFKEPNKSISYKIATIIKNEYASPIPNETKIATFKKINQEQFDNLLSYLIKLDLFDSHHKELKEKQKCDIHTIIAKSGDRLFLHQFQNGTLMLQGFPAYLYTEAINFLAENKLTNLTEIINSTKKFYSVNITKKQTNEAIKNLLPNIYNKIDHAIIKLFSPGIILSNIEINNLSDYTHITNPAFRALDSYIKWCFSKKDIKIEYNYSNILDKNNKNNFGKHIIKKVNNNKNWLESMKKIFCYYTKTRHPLSHGSQVPIKTKMITKYEAVGIVNTVAALMESTFKDLVE